jgi:hypothetical protein
VTDPRSSPALGPPALADRRLARFLSKLVQQYLTERLAHMRSDGDGSAASALRAGVYQADRDAGSGLGGRVDLHARAAGER